jgi:putative copper resistance protein D
VTLLIAVIRWIHEASLMVMFGSAALLALLRLSLPGAGLRLSLAGVALSSALLWFFLAAVQMGGTVSDHVLWLALTQSQFGQIFQARLVLLILACVAAWTNWRQGGLTLLSGAALVLISVTSHAAEASPAHFTAIGTISDGLHFLTGGFWIGGLTVLAMLFASGDENFAGATARFAEWGMIAVAVLVLTGMLNAATILLGGDGADTPLYLAVLGAKLVLATAMVTLALVNHFRLLPRLAEPGMGVTLDRNIRAELTIGLVVVGLAALLGLLPPTMGS